MKLYGVFVGVDTYADPHINDLSYAHADAKSLYELARQSLDPDECQLQILTDSTATKQTIMKSIGEDLSRLVTKDDIVLLFFSGHGSPEMYGSIDKISRYLVLHDTDYYNIFATGLDMERELPRICFERIRAKLILVLVDTCFSGLAGGKTFRGPQLAKYRGVKLNQMELGEGRLIMTASADDELAREYKKLGHGVFTHFLIETLTDVSYKEPFISIPILYDVIVRKVMAYTKERQRPTLHGKFIGSASLPMFVNQESKL